MEVLNNLEYFFLFFFFATVIYMILQFQHLNGRELFCIFKIYVYQIPGECCTNC